MKMNLKLTKRNHASQGRACAALTRSMAWGLRGLSLLMLSLGVAASADAAVLRVNNDPGAGAQYTSLNDALTDAAQGDVIILDPSNTSYGDATITRAVTIQGSGYFKEVNRPTQTGNAPSEVGKITVKATDVKLCGLMIDAVDVLASKTIITRCNVGTITLGALYSDVGPITDCIIHQNFIRNYMTGSQYGTEASEIQITNNIFRSTTSGIAHVNNSVAKYNTLNWNDSYKSAFGMKNSVITHNIGGNAAKDSGSNTISDNFEHSMVKPYGNEYDITDAKVKEVDQEWTTEHGAFAGDDPYLLSGIPAGPVVESVSVPASVESGQPLEVVVKIGVSK